MLDKLTSETDAPRQDDARAGSSLAVLIVGMHRSGTSALSGVLNLLGVAVPEDLHPADEHNAKGYFEPQRIIAFHEDLLAKIGSPSDDPLPLTDDWMRSPLGRPAVEALADILDQEFGDNAMCLFKDPRMCRLVPLWAAALARSGRGFVAILPCRHPLEVAGSLQNKGGVPRGRALMWWLHHVVKAEQSTRAMPRSFTLYDELLGQWRPLVDRLGEQLGIEWPRDMMRAAPEIDAFLTGGMRHHQTDAADLDGDELHRLCARAWAAMTAFTRDPYDPAAKDEIDEIARRLDNTLPVFAPVVVSYQHQLGRLEEHLRRHYEEVEAHNRNVSRVHAEALERLRGDLARLTLDSKAKLDAADRKLAKVQARADERIRFHSQRAHEALTSLSAVHASPFWTVSGPTRRLLTRHRGLRTLGRRLTKAAWWTVTFRLGRKLREQDQPLLDTASPTDATSQAESGPPAPGVRNGGAQLRVMFISGESHTPGHLYRVERYAEAARTIGGDVRVIDIDEVLGQTEVFAGVDVVIIWRAPWSEAVVTAAEAARAAGAVIVFDVDDLMFEPSFATTALIDGIRSQGLDEEDVRVFYERVLGTLSLADYGSAPTPFLAQRMRLYEKPSFVLPNGFDEEVLARSRLEARIRGTVVSDGLVRIGYPTGSRTHQKDFSQAAAALARVLRARSQARLVLFRRNDGPVLDPAEFPALDGLHDQIEWRTMAPIENLPTELARFDINIAPLEAGNPFCEAKSELKFFEAALVDVPTIATPTEPFRDVIRHGENGLLAATEDEWFDALLKLVDDPGLRRSMAKAALYDSLADYGPERRAELFLSMIEQILPDPRRIARAFELELGRRFRKRASPHIPPHEIVFASDRLGTAEAAVIIPLYNYRDYIAEALDSVRGQTVEALDLIVVNDASTDDSEAVALAWIEANAQRFNRVLLIRNVPNAGLGFSRNVGFANAETPYVLPLDADNRLLPDFVERALEALARSGAAWAYPRIRQFGDNDGGMGHQPWHPGRLITGNFIDAMAVIRRSAWAQAGGYDHVRHGWEDYDFWLRLVERGGFGVQLDEELAEYRVHGASMLRSETELYANKTRLLKDMARRHPWVRLESPPAPTGEPMPAPEQADSAGPAETRLTKLLPLLRCPVTGAALERAGSELRVVGTDRRWPIVQGRPVLFEGLGEPKVFPDEHVSNRLPENALRLIEESKGPVLNLSAGGTSQRFDHVVEAEFAVFRHTDVLADAHNLPFADETFDLVVSMNAFEHYHTPAKAAAEILRVLKPGGKVLVRTAFLQPLHEAPWHFYNCTRYGLEHWFNSFETLDVAVPDGFNPLMSLSWQVFEAESLLRSELGGEEADRLLDASGRDLTEIWRDRANRSHPLWRSFFSLSQPARERLAAGFEYLGRKPE